MNVMRATTLALLALAAVVADADTRSDIDEIAAAIEANYFDARRAAAIANELRNSAAAGELDRFANKSELASELTRRLRRHDGHFNVAWQAKPSRASDSATSSPRRRVTPLPESRTNHGFKRIERLPGNIGYLELTYAADIDFSRADSPARRAADAALALVRDADAVILDLRSHAGGAPSMVGYLVSAFVDAKADVYNTFHSRAGTQSERPAKPYATPMLSTPLYVLTSGRTGSAGEAIAFTLQSAQRAQIVGERSAGAANPAEMFDTPSGYRVLVSTGSPRNPINGRNWEGEGVKPDVEVSAAAALPRAQELALTKVLAGSIDGAERQDAQWALEALRAQAGARSRKPPADVAGDFGMYALEIEDGVLQARRARWPAMTLVPLASDLYYFEDNPSRRVAIERENGKVVAISIRGSDGGEQRYLKQP